MRACVRAAVAALAVLAGVPSIASGQSQEPAATPAARRVTAGAEVTVVAGPVDDEAFFNFTDYEHNALRVARIRLMGEWRIAPRFSILGEARTENGDGIQVPAFYARWQPWARHDLTVQAGIIPPVIGAYPRRAYGRDNVGSDLRSACPVPSRRFARMRCRRRSTICQDARPRLAAEVIRSARRRSPRVSPSSRRLGGTRASRPTGGTVRLRWRAP